MSSRILASDDCAVPHCHDRAEDGPLCVEHERRAKERGPCPRCRDYGTAVVCRDPGGHRNGCGCPLVPCPECGS